MSYSLRILVLLLGLALFLPGSVLAEDDPKEDPKDEPTEQPKEEPKEEPDDDDPPPVIEDMPEEPEDEPAVPEKPPARMATPQVFEKDGTPGGMVWVPPGSALVGTKFQRLRKLTDPRSKDVKRDFRYEAPQHTVQMSGYFLDRYEVTNAQYLAFMQDTAKASYDSNKASLANLEEVAGSLIGLPRDRWSYDDVAWRQLYQANKEKLHEAMPDRVVTNTAGVLLPEKTEKSFHHAPLPRGLMLEFYNRKPPETWPSMKPAEVTLDFPVLSVSYDDTEAFAEWAGKHVPTEQEWEYAGRGPEGYVWPWGDEWFEDVSRANWGGKHIDDHFNPIAMPVGSLPDGQSWCGVFDLLGNAGEWTSSWFNPYPGNEDEEEHRFMGQYVKVIRGATYVDQDPLVLRLAARNFIGAGVKAPPRPGNRFEYIGFRCAWYEQPGRDQIGPIIRRVSRGRRVTEKNIRLDRYAGSAAVKFAAAGEEVENHVFVNGKAHAIVLIPLKYSLRPDLKEPKFRSRKKLKAWSVESDDPLPLAVLHTDIALDKVLVRAPRNKKADDKKKKKKRGKKEPPATVRGTCPPGTYLIGYWHERLCITLPSLEFVCFLSKGAAKTGTFDLAEVKPDNFPSASIEVEADADILFVGFATPLGGASHDEEDTLVVKTLELNLKQGELSDAGTWRTYVRQDD